MPVDWPGFTGLNHPIIHLTTWINIINLKISNPTTNIKQWFSGGQLGGRIYLIIFTLSHLILPFKWLMHLNEFDLLL